MSVGQRYVQRAVLRTGDDKLAPTAESHLVGDAYEEVEVTREGGDIEIAFNAKYLLDAPAALEEESLQSDGYRKKRSVGDGREYTDLMSAYSSGRCSRSQANASARLR
jgi:DNA polymerase III beta subunit, C-terminal domain